MPIKRKHASAATAEVVLIENPLSPRFEIDLCRDDDYFQTALCESVTPNIDEMEMVLETAGHTIRAHAESMDLVEAAAADFNRSPVLKVVVRDEATIDALTLEQVRGKVLLLDFTGSNVRGTRQQIMSLQPSLVVALRANTGSRTPLNRPAMTCRSAAEPIRQTKSVNSVAWLLVWDDAILAAFRSGKPGPDDTIVTIHIPPPTVGGEDTKRNFKHAN